MVLLPYKSLQLKHPQLTQGLQAAAGERAPACRPAPSAQRRQAPPLLLPGRPDAQPQMCAAAAAAAKDRRQTLARAPVVHAIDFVMRSMFITAAVPCLMRNLKAAPVLLVPATAAACILERGRCDKEGSHGAQAVLTTTAQPTAHAASIARPHCCWHRARLASLLLTPATPCDMPDTHLKPMRNSDLQQPGPCLLWHMPSSRLRTACSASSQESDSVTRHG